MAVGSALSDKYKRGHLDLVDDLKQGDKRIAGALNTYADSINGNKHSRQWVRAVQWIENTLFGLGRHYIEDLLSSRINADAAGNLTVNESIQRDIPKPTNDMLGRYIETNIALLTENRPIPRVTAKSDSAKDKQAADLSELTIEYLWEELDLPEKHREIARILLYCGTAFLEVWYDPLQPRYMTVPETTTEPTTPVGGGTVQAPIPREVPVLDPATGEFKYSEEVAYGDIVANVCSPFEMHLPNQHWWDSEGLGWVMRESYESIDSLKNKYSHKGVNSIVTKRNGYFPENIEKINRTEVQNLPLWWWERLTDTVEGPGPSLHVGSPEQWEDYCVVRVFDRKPNAKWPRGRTIIVAGDQVIYDSPKKIGARAFDPRWPKRWHPYVRYRWEGMMGSIYGRSLVSKLLPKLKRVNAIDTTIIMWRRTVPMASWILPKGSSPVEDLHSGQIGSYITYDPRKTQQMEPKPVYPPSYPAAALQERETQIAEMESIAGTESILRGQRPTGVNSAAMLDTLRKQALASRSAILQAWDESLQKCGGALLQENIKHIKADPRYKQRINILAREKASSFTIDEYSGSNLSDNVQVRIDTASQAMVSREAHQERAIEVLQYGQGLAVLPPGLRAQVISDLGWPDVLAPQGADIHRARALIQYLKSERFDLAVPMPEDDPYVIHELLVNEMKMPTFIDLPGQVQAGFMRLIDLYKDEIEKIEAARMQFMQMQGGGGGSA